MTKPQFLGLFLLVLLPACAALQGDQDREITLYILLSGLHLDVREVYHFRAIPEHGDPVEMHKRFQNGELVGFNATWRVNQADDYLSAVFSWTGPTHNTVVVSYLSAEGSTEVLGDATLDLAQQTEILFPDEFTLREVTPAVR